MPCGTLNIVYKDNLFRNQVDINYIILQILNINYKNIILRLAAFQFLGQVRYANSQILNKTIGLELKSPFILINLIDCYEQFLYFLQSYFIDRNFLHQ